MVQLKSSFPGRALSDPISLAHLPTAAGGPGPHSLAILSRGSMVALSNQTYPVPCLMPAGPALHGQSSSALDPDALPGAVPSPTGMLVQGSCYSWAREWLSDWGLGSLPRPQPQASVLPPLPCTEHPLMPWCLAPAWQRWAGQCPRGCLHKPGLPCWVRAAALTGKHMKHERWEKRCQMSIPRDGCASPCPVLSTAPRHPAHHPAPAHLAWLLSPCRFLLHDTHTATRFPEHLLSEALCQWLSYVTHCHPTATTKWQALAAP